MLRRSDLTRERLDEIASASGVAVATDEELARSRSAVLDRRPAGDLWVFGYGSLMWNPTLSITEARVARLDGWQRSFCIPMPGGRGTPEHPGLMCGLIPSGHCFGLALRIAEDEIESETAALWIREMAFGSYVPSMVPVTVDDGRVDALAFTAEPSRARRLSIDDQAQRIAGAAGHLGSNRDYLFRLESALTSSNIGDPYIAALARRVRTLRSHADPS
jgi:cation transport protein ChaC